MGTSRACVRTRDARRSIFVSARRLWPIAFAVAPLFVARAASSAEAPSVRMPAYVAGLVVAPNAALVVQRVSFAVTCVDRDGPRCRLDATYRFANPTPARAEVVAAFRGAPDPGTTGLSILWPFAARVDGRDVSRVLSADERALLSGLARPPAFVPERGLVMALDAGATGDVVVTTEIFATATASERPSVPIYLTAIEARHPWLGTKHEYARSAQFELSAAISGGTAPPVDVTVRIPSAWSLGAPPLDGGAWTATTAGGTTTATTRATTAATPLLVHVVVPETRVHHGGPLVGVGLGIDRAGARARLGYEIAAPAAWTIESLAVETDFSGRANVVPAVEIASPSVLIVMPSFGVGVGAPVQLRSDGPARVGVRAQLSFALPCVSFVFPIDTYPSAPRGERYQSAALLQASF